MWTNEEDNILRDTWNTYGKVNKLIATLNKTKSVIYTRARQLGLINNTVVGEPLTEDRVDLVLENLRQRKNLRTACEDARVNYHTFKAKVKKEAFLKDRYKEAKEYAGKRFKCNVCKGIFLLEENCVKIGLKCTLRRCKPCSKVVMKEYYTGSINGYISQLATRCKNSEKGCEIDSKFLKQLYKDQQGKCYYTGIVLTTPDVNQYGIFTKISADRVDSNKGYFKDNVVLCCWGVNKMKSNIDLAQFINTCNTVANRFISTVEATCY